MIAVDDVGFQTAFTVLERPPALPGERLGSSRPLSAELASTEAFAELLRAGLVRRCLTQLVEDHTTLLINIPCVLSPWQAREDGATRKAAFDALQNALPRGEAARPPWSHFVVLWKLLQQFPLHIVQEPFAQHMQQLRAGAPPGPANGCATTQPLKTLITLRGQYPEPCWCSAHAEALPYSVAWEAVLWRVGFLHSNPQVRLCDSMLRGNHATWHCSPCINWRSLQ